MNKKSLTEADIRTKFITPNILVELRDAGNKGEYYTPRAITQLMTRMTNPRLGEHVLDPAAGTAGFLSAAIRRME